MRKSNKIMLTILILLVVVLAACQSDSEPTEKALADGIELEQMVWGVYDVGSSGYVEMSAIANSMTEDYNMNIRMLPATSGIGRISLIRNDIASIARTGDEVNFAFEGMYEFINPLWGPQKTSLVWGAQTVLGGLVQKDSDIKSYADLKGKRVPYIVGNNSMNMKIEALLAFGGLTWDDVKKVELTSYVAQGEALMLGQVDIAALIPSASVVVEAESKVGVRWLELDSNDTEGWKRIQDIASWLVTKVASHGGAEATDKKLMGFSYPIAAYQDEDEEVVYQFVKALNESYDSYKGATLGMSEFHIDTASTTPIALPFHKGTIRYLEEKGYWNDEKQALNDALLERSEKLQVAWDKVMEMDLSQEELEEYWSENKESLIQ